MIKFKNVAKSHEIKGKSKIWQNLFFYLIWIRAGCCFQMAVTWTYLLLSVICWLFAETQSSLALFFRVLTFKISQKTAFGAVALVFGSLKWKLPLSLAEPWLHLFKFSIEMIMLWKYRKEMLDEFIAMSKTVPVEFLKDWWNIS